MTVLELNHVALHVSDVGRSCAFYGEVLRLELMPRPAFTFPGAWFRLGAQELHLIGGRNDPVSSHNRGNHFALRVGDLTEWTSHLRKAGVPFRGPQRRPDGAFQVFVQDPDGHVIELFWPGPVERGAEPEIKKSQA